MFDSADPFVFKYSILIPKYEETCLFGLKTIIIIYVPHKLKSLLNITYQTL